MMIAGITVAVSMFIGLCVWTEFEARRQDREELKRDVRDYWQAQREMEHLIDIGRIETQQFRDAWAHSERIKNKHGGMPPRLER